MILSIVEIVGREILDSRGNPTVEAQVTVCNEETGKKYKGRAAVPSGASTGKFEAIELRDGEERYFGLGVKHAVRNIHEKIAPVLQGKDALKQAYIDTLLIQTDGTDNKGNLGANATLAVSLAVAKAAAKGMHMPLYRYLGGVNGNELPMPMMNILNGGAHASNNVDIQEFMILPREETFADALRIGSEIYHKLGKILGDKGLRSGVGDEGGFAPNIKSDREALELICEAIVTAGFGFDRVGLALDIASSEWYRDGKYFMPKRGVYLSSGELIKTVEELCRDFPIISVEDPLSEDDWDGWCELTKKIGSRVQLVGDDLFVTNTNRLEMGINRQAGNAILIKPNQIGTVTETLDVINLAAKNGYNTVISHRSGESEDTFIADLAVAVNAAMIKSGAPCRTDRVAKYNRLLAIENALRG